MKTILFDIETAPIMGYVWGLYEQNVLEVVRPTYLLCFAWKELGKKDLHCPSLPDFKLFGRDPEDDKALVKELWKVLDSADIIVAHNGDNFDCKKANAFFIKHGMEPPSPYLTVDTLKEARKVFKFDSNKLDAIGEFLKLGRKAHTGGFSLWKGCMDGDMASWRKMVRYCKQDVVLLEGAYKKLLPWMKSHPNVALHGGHTGCPKCGGLKLIKRGYRYTATSKIPRYRCSGCGSWCSGKKEKGSQTAEYRIP
jgi:DNA polymerase elongation subunit (family B)